jgi:glycosyltransferase 2 family protein
MLRALHPISRIEALHRAHRLPIASRAGLMAAARWLFTVIAFSLVMRSVDFGTVLDLIDRAELPGLALAGVVAVVQFALLAWRWQFVLRMLGSEAVGFGTLSVFLGYSFLIGQILPSSVGGDVARAAMLAQRTGAAAAARSVVCDRVLGFAGLALLAVPALPIAAGTAAGFTLFLTVTTAALGTVAVFAVVLASPSFGDRVPWVGRSLATVAGDLRITLGSGKLSLAAVALGLASNLANVVLIYFLGLAIGAGLRAIDCLILVPPVLLVSALPISLAGWGVREGALVAAFSLVHTDPASVLATSVMSGLTTPLLGAVVVTASMLTSWRDLLPKRAS